MEQGEKPRGGTELLLEGLNKHVSKELLEKSLVTVCPPQIGPRHLKPLILWEHQSYDQPSVQCLHDGRVRTMIDQYVFVSEWQRSLYLKYFTIPNEKTAVIHNAIERIPIHVKPKGKLKLIYTSTPFRGLDVLLDAFLLLNRTDVELHIYSGMGLYGRSQEDAVFEPLYKKARGMQNVHYHGVVSNEKVREALQEAHIFAFPSTWEETSCVSLVEAQSAGCLAVVPSLGALPETAGGFAQLYAYTENKKAHAQLFAKQLNKAIDTFWQIGTQQKLAEQRDYFNTAYSWSVRKGEWEFFLSKVIKKM